MDSVVKNGATMVAWMERKNDKVLLDAAAQKIRCSSVAAMETVVIWA